MSDHDTDLIARLRAEAQCHAQEARTANATIAEIYQLCTGATGEPGNWHGAEPVRAKLESLTAALARAEQDAERMRALINTPETADFIEGMKREVAHQVQRWGYAHDRSKSAENWFWLVGYLTGKALRSAITGDHEKARHHTISSGAALFNWHTAITHDTTGAGVGQDADLRATNPIDAQAADDAARAPDKGSA